MVPSKAIYNGVLLFISRLIPSLLMLATTIILSRYLSTNDYGIYQSVWSMITVSIVITTLGLPKYILTFGNIDFKTHFKSIFTISSISILAISCYIIGSYNNINLQNKFLLIAIILSQSVFLIQESTNIFNQKNIYLIGVNAMYACLLFCSQIIIMYYFTYNLTFFLLAILLISILRNILLHIWQHNSKPQYNNYLNTTQLFLFGLNELMAILTKWFDKFLLIMFLTPTHFAIYFNGTIEIPLIGMLLSVFQSIMASHSSKSNINDNEQIALFNSSSLVMAGILFPIFALSIFYSKEIIELIFSSKYSESSTLFAISALVLPLRICNYSVLLQIKEKGKIIIWGSIIDFVATAILMWLLYPYYQLAGLVIAGVFGIYLLAGFYTFHICTTYHTSFLKLLNIPQLAFKMLVTIATVGGINMLFDGKISFIFAIIASFLLFVFFSGKTLIKGFIEGK